MSDGPLAAVREHYLELIHAGEKAGLRGSALGRHIATHLAPWELVELLREYLAAQEANRA